METTGAVADDVRRVRERLERLCLRAAGLRHRLEADGPSILRLDRLEQEARLSTAAAAGTPRKAERWEAEEADLHSDTWEISLINEEGS